MEAGVAARTTLPNPTRILDLLARVVLVSLLFTILAGMLLAILRTFWDLRFLLSAENFSEAFKQIVIRALAILALVEVYRTAYVYFTERRVKVTYIVDTVLIVLMTEILSVWFAETDYRRISAAVVLLLSLGFIRVLAIRYSPARTE